MSNRSITSGVTRLANMLIAAEKQLAQIDAAHKRYMAVQEDTLAQMRVTLDDAAVMLGIIPQIGSATEKDTHRELPAGPPSNPASGPQATFTATDREPHFKGMDV
jgi:hypothetical protein